MQRAHFKGKLDTRDPESYRSGSMLIRFRQRTRYAAAALLVSLVTLGAPHSLDPHHDADWDVGVVAHDESAHRFGAPGPNDSHHPIHCIACHWARSFRPYTVSAHIPAPRPKSTRLVFSDLVPVPTGQAVVQPPLRAPPVSSDVV